jgi:hypothetical protein
VHAASTNVRAATRAIAGIDRVKVRLLLSPE